MSTMCTEKLKHELHCFVIFTLPMIKFGHTQMRMPKIGVPVLKTTCINPWEFTIIKDKKFSFVNITNRKISV